MKDSDVRVGMRVVPHDKTAGCSLIDCVNWRNAKAENQPYLFVVEKYGKAWVLSSHAGKSWNTEYFNASDFEPYDDLDYQIAEVERELERLKAERDTAKLLPVGAEVWVRGTVVDVDEYDAEMHHRIKFFDYIAPLWIRDENIKEVE